MPNLNLCQKCGACCASFKVLFPSDEVDDHEGGRVPHQHTVRIDARRSAMRGTLTFNKRCVALEGIVGQYVSCAIYGNRPSACQNFRASWEGNAPNETCDRARNWYGLQPFCQSLGNL